MNELEGFLIEMIEWKWTIRIGATVRNEELYREDMNCSECKQSIKWIEQYL